MSTLPVTVCTQHDAPIILPATDTTPAVVALPYPDAPEPDEFTPPHFSKVVLSSKDGDNWDIAYTTNGNHPASPYRIVMTMDRLRDAGILARYLTAFSPDNLRYIGTHHESPDHSTYYAVVSTYPNGKGDHSRWDDPRFTPGLNWARGTVHRLAAVVPDHTSGTYSELPSPTPFPIYGTAEDLPSHPHRQPLAYSLLASLRTT